MTEAKTFDRDSVETALALAIRAPSIHNTQPWAWRLTADGLLLLAERSRQLAVADPDGHALHISCGAALELTEVGLAAQGWQVETTVLPDPADPDVLARFVPVTRGAPDEKALELAEAAAVRRSDRRPFAPDPVTEDEEELLRAASSDDQAWFHFPRQEDERIDLAVAVSWADRVERDDPAYREEMHRWLHDPDVHPSADGVPLNVVPRVDESHPRRADVPPRDFEVGVTGHQLIDADVDEHPLIAVGLTNFDTPPDQLAAGRGMVRLMVAAQAHGLTTCPLTQAVDFSAFRTRLQRSMGWVGRPQIMLRVGHPSGPVTEIPSTPRRPVSAVLQVADDA